MVVLFTAKHGHGLDQRHFSRIMVRFLRVAGRHMVALVLLQAYITSRLGHIRWEHSQAGHTHIDPDVGLRCACNRLLAEEEEVAGKELQLCLACPAFQDDLQREKKKTMPDFF